MTEPEFLETDIVLFLHDAGIAEHGGNHGLRDAGLLDSAVFRPRNQFAYAAPGGLDLYDLAAAYAFGLAKNHAFMDGNKRVAWAAAVAFLAGNSIQVDVSAHEAIATVISLATGATTEDAFAAWLRALPARTQNATP